VSSRGDGLEERVDSTVVAAADEAIATAERATPSAAEHLGKAWSVMYGRTPNHREAVDEAVRAVEAATEPTVTAEDFGTLSEVLRELDQDGRWVLPMSLEWGTSRRVTDPGPVLAGMVKTVWHGQGERHGSPTSATPVSSREAETIVMTAVALVHLFTAGLVRQATP